MFAWSVDIDNVTGLMSISWTQNAELFQTKFMA